MGRPDRSQTSGRGALSHSAMGDRRQLGGDYTRRARGLCSMNVMEIYRSVQGEGSLMGVPTTFVRFFACNLRCSWCDTKYSWSVREGGTWEPLSPQQVAACVQELGARHVVLTGGEPTLQKELPHLAQLLKEQGHHLTVE